MYRKRYVAVIDQNGFADVLHFFILISSYKGVIFMISYSIALIHAQQDLTLDFQ